MRFGLALPHYDFSVPPAQRHPLRALLRGGLYRFSAVLARAEAAAGHGAVVDIIARRDEASANVGAYSINKAGFSGLERAAIRRIR